MALFALLFALATYGAPMDLPESVDRAPAELGLDRDMTGRRMLADASALLQHRYAPRVPARAGAGRKAVGTMDREMWKQFARDATGLPQPRHSDRDAFAAQVLQLSAFVAGHGSAPDSGSDDAYEARLGSWLDAQRMAQ